MPLLIATTNPGKVREIRLALATSSITILTLHEWSRRSGRPIPAEPEETGRTFAANALLKAHYYASQTKIPTVAEDSGLAIDALGGRPGVESARYPGATYPEKFANLYRELAPHARPWTARYVCSIAMVAPASNEVRYTGEATVEGEIAHEPAGTNGFGYDPIFFFPPYGQTLGQVTDEQKLVISHRGKAFAALRQWLRGSMGQ